VSDPETYSVEFRRPTAVADRLKQRLGTDELPTEVVRQKATVWIWSADAPDPSLPREGGFSMGYTLGDRENPELAPDEAKYMLRLIEHAAKTWRAAFEILPE
jgi:hypothetical protein